MINNKRRLNFTQFAFFPPQQQKVVCILFTYSGGHFIPGVYLQLSLICFPWVLNIHYTIKDYFRIKSQLCNDRKQRDRNECFFPFETIFCVFSANDQNFKTKAFFMARNQIEIANFNARFKIVCGAHVCDREFFFRCLFSPIAQTILLIFFCSFCLIGNSNYAHLQMRTLLQFLIECC